MDTNALSLGQWFGDLGDCYDSAVNNHGEETQNYTIAGQNVRFRFAGSSLQQIYCPAFKHLERIDEATDQQSLTDLSILIFQETDSSLRLPKPPVSIEDFSPRGDIRGFSNKHFKTAFQPFGKIISSYSIARKTAIVCVGDLASVYNFERAAPLRSLLGWFMREKGLQLAHAAAVAFQGQGLLLSGKSGSGKSNTALASIASGLDYISDDFCAITSNPEPTAYSLYGTGRTRTEDFLRLPFLESLVDRREDFPQDKELYLLNCHFPSRLITKCKLKAVMLPRIDPSQPLSLEPISRQEALLSLAPITATLLPDAGPEVLMRLGKLVRSLPCFRLNLGPDIQKVPGFLKRSILEPLPTSSISE